MAPTSKALYRAYAARDPRFDGVFFIGVTSTGIYCRPVCPAKTPKPGNCRFFPSAAAAERARFRPCLRCRPELAPGLAPVDGPRRLANRVATRIGEGMLDDGAGLEAMATELGMSSRQVRRIVQRELGVSPIDLVQTRRLLLAKQLLTETALPVIEVAYASGFASLRRFNDAFRKHYGMPPTRFRKVAVDEAVPSSMETITLQLSYRPPFDWTGVLAFLRTRALAGVESVDETGYRRTVRLGGIQGWLQVGHAPQKRAVMVELSHTLMPALPAVLTRLRHLFDLNARPDVIAAHLARDGHLAALVARAPGLRVPGAFDGFELALRAILGQQITVKAATTLASRVMGAYGEPMKTPLPGGLTHFCPTADRLAGAAIEEVASLGIIQTRARSMIALAAEVAGGRLRVEAGADPEGTIARLVALPGIGPWTAQYIAMRALRWPDAFPKEDVALRQRLGGVSPAEAEALAEAWRPWRSYALLHLWRQPVGTAGGKVSAAAGASRRGANRPAARG